MKSFAGGGGLLVVFFSLCFGIPANPASAQTIYYRHLNLNFGSGTNLGPAAFTAGTTNQPWNIIPGATTVASNYTYYGTSTTVPVITHDTFTNLVYATGSNAPVTVTITNLLSMGHNYAENVMFDSFLSINAWLVVDDWNEDLMEYINIHANPAIALRHLPAGTYDLYLYGAGGSYYDGEGFRVKVGNNAFSSWKYTAPPDPIDVNWTENTHYVLFTNLVVATNDTVYIELAEGYEYDVVNGLQIVDLTSTNGPPPQLPAVAFDPAGGAIVPVNVALSVSGHGDATIYYTTDGSTPTTMSSVYSSAIALSAPTTVKAFAVKSGYTDSGISSSFYNYPQLPGVTFNPAGGTALPVNLALSVAGHADATIHYTLDGSPPTTASAVYSASIQLTTNDWAYLANQNPGMTSHTAPAGYIATFSTENTGTGGAAWKALDRSTSTLWKSAGTGPEWLAFEFPGARVIAKYAVICGPNAGEAPRSWTFEGWDGSQYVVLDTRSSQTGWSATERREYVCTNNASFARYRLNISQGNTSSSNPGANIVVAELEMFEAKTTVTAFATKTAYLDSPVVAAGYHAPASAIPQVAPPAFASPSSGAYQNAINVTLATDLAGATIRYTTNGTDWTDYTGALSFDGGPVTLQTKTTKAGYVDSGGKTFVYTFAVAPTVMSPPGGGFENTVNVVLTNLTVGATIEYSINSGSLSAYTAPVTLTESTQVTAIGSKAGYTSSTNSAFFTEITSLLSAQRRLNINLGSGSRTGHAAPGTNTVEQWNTIGLIATNVSETYQNGGPVVPIKSWGAATNLVWSDGAAAPVNVVITNLTTLTSGYHNDPMLGSYLGSEQILVWDYDSQTEQEIIITADPAVAVQNLPADSYDVYVYGLGPNYNEGYEPDNEGFAVKVGSGSLSSWKWTAHPGTLHTNWQDNVQYVRFTNIAVQAGQELVLRLAGNSQMKHLINGLQIISRSNNVAPFVTLTAPTNGTVQIDPGYFTISATALDPDGLVDRIEFFNGTTLLGSDLAAPFSHYWENVGVGNYSISVKAYDKHGASVESPAVAVSVVPPVVPPVQQYLITDLGRGKAFGINDYGQVVGESYDLVEGRTRAFLWTPANFSGTNGTLLDIGGTNASLSSWAAGINNDGDVVGRYQLELPYEDEGTTTVLFGFRWTADAAQSTNGVFLNLGTLAGHSLHYENFSRAEAINDDGWVVGEFSHYYETYYGHGLVWLPETTVDLGAFPGWTSISHASAINEAGQVAGFTVVFDGAVYDYANHAVVWTNGSPESAVDLDLSVPNGGTYYSEAHDLNVFGQVAGVKDGKAAVWTSIRPESLENLGTLSGHSGAAAMAINNQGVLVGSSGNWWDASSYRPFIYDNQNGYGPNRLRNLNSLIPANSGWLHLLSAEDINDNGQIVGYGRVANGDIHAFLLTPPHLVTPDLPVVSLAVVVEDAGENCDPGQKVKKIKVEVSEPPAADLPVTVAIVNVTTNGVVSPTVTQTVVVASGNTSATIEPDANNGLNSPANEKSAAALRNTQDQKNNKGGVSKKQPEVSVAASALYATESGTETAAFTLSLGQAAETDVQVAYTIGGTAVSGADFDPLSGTATIPAGELSVAIEVAAEDDGFTEMPETVTLTISASAGSGYKLGSSTDATVVILDDDNPENIANPVRALVKHAPKIHQARIEGSLQMLLGESPQLSGQTVVNGNLLVPGTPAVNVSGSAEYGGTIDGTGAVSPSGYTLDVGANISLWHVIRRKDPASLPSFSAPPNPSGSVDVVVTSPNPTINFSTLRHLTLGKKVGNVPVPAGTYGDFSVDRNSGLVLGVQGATSASVYNLQNLNLANFSALRVVGPVILNISNRVDLKHDALLGSIEHPEWVELKFSGRTFSLDNGAAMYAIVKAPNAFVVLGAHTRLRGGLACDGLDMRGNSLLELSVPDGQPENNPPAALADAYELNEDSTLNISAPGVLANDSDPESSALTAVLVANASHGSLTLNGNGSFQYTPNANYFGNDSFAYKATDGTNDSATATVTLTIHPVNDAPVVVANSYSVDEDATLSPPAPGVLANDSDVDGDAITAVLVSGPAFGSLNFNANGSFLYTPAANFHGSDGFTYKANDGLADSVSVSVSITVAAVNDAPVASAQSVTTNEDTAKAVTLTGSDVDGDALTYTVVAQPTKGVLSGTAPNLTYTPNANEHGSDSFTFKVNDGTVDSAVATVSVTVDPVNDAPTLNTLANVTVDEDAATQVVNLSGIGTGAANETQTLVVTATSSNPGLIPNPSVTYTSPDATGSLSFTPVANLNGSVTITVTVDDGQAANNTVVRAFTVTVNAVNDAPVFTLSTNLVAELEDFTGSRTVTVTPAPVPADEAGQTVAYSLSPAGVGFASVAINATTGEVTISALANGYGTNVFTVTASDGQSANATHQQTFTLEIAAVNDAPVASAGQDQTIPYNETANLQASATDDGWPLGSVLAYQWSKTSGPGAVTFADESTAGTSATFGQAGTYVLRVTVDDGDIVGFDEMVVTATMNIAPGVSAGADKSVIWSKSAALTITTNAAPSLAGLPDSRGTNFWLTFSDARVRMYSPDGLSSWIAYPSLSLHITGDSAASGTVSVPGLSFSTNFSVMPGVVCEIALPGEVMTQGSDVKTANGIHVTADAEVSVYGLSLMDATTDAYTALPSDVLGTNYVIMSYRNVETGDSSYQSEFHDTEFTVVATEDNTTLTLTLTETLVSFGAASTPAASTRYRQVPFNIILNKGEVYQIGSPLQYPADLSGSTVVSDKPVAVFGSHRCANVPASFFACDHLIEQLAPITAWGEEFAIMPLATRKGDTLRIVAAENGTQVILNGNATNTLGKGQLLEWIAYEPTHVKTDKPVAVFQYSNGLSFDHPEFDPNDETAYTLADPFMTMVPPVEQFLNAYTVINLDYDRNFISLVVPAAGLGRTAVDGTLVSVGQFQPIGATGFYGAKVQVAPGAHTLTGDLPFGITVYGFAYFDSYGYSGGMLMGPVALVSDLAVTPQNATVQVGQGQVMTATVTDQNQNPLKGIRVDFIAEGENSMRGFAITDVNGQAQYEVAGQNVGSTQVQIRVGRLGVSTTVNWVSPSVNLAGMVSDDDLPSAAALNSNWTKVSGPGNVVFGNSALPSTTASFSLPGTYVLRLTATDTEYDRYDEVTVTANENLPPVVSAGADQLISLMDTASLGGSLTDDGLPSGVTPSVAWTKVTGPGAVTFTDSIAASTTASFSEAGIYVLRMTGTDTLATAFDDVVIKVQYPGGSTAPAGTLFNVNFGSGSRVGHGVVGVSGSDAWNLVTAGTGYTNNLVWYDGTASPVTLILSNLNNLATNSSPDVMLHSQLYGFDVDEEENPLPGSVQVEGLPAGSYDVLIYNLETQPYDHGYSITTGAGTTPTKYTSIPFEEEQSYWVNGRQYVVFTNVVVGTSESMTVNLPYLVEAYPQIAGMQIVVHTGDVFPEVTLPPDQVLTLPATNLVLTGTVLNDEVSTAQWSQEGGPGEVSFSNEIAVLEAGDPGFSTSVTFTNAGLYTLRLTAWDDVFGASRTVRVLVNNAPVAAPDSVSFNQGVQVFTISTLTQNDSDPDQQDNVKLVGVGTPSHGRAVVDSQFSSVVYYPERGYVGTDTFDYVITDGHGAYSSAAITVTINPRGYNTAPVAVADVAYVDQGSLVSIEALLNDTDVDFDSVKFVSVGAPSHGQASLSSSYEGIPLAAILYMPDVSFYGLDTFTYIIDDGFGGSAIGTVTVYVNPSSNNDPVAVGDNYTFAYGSQNQTLNVMANDSDPDSDEFWILSFDTENLQIGTLTPVYDTQTGRIVSFTYSNSGQDGSEQFDYTLVDAWGAQSTATVIINTLPPNYAPIANYESDEDSYNATEDVELIVASPGVLGNDYDQNGDTMTASLVTGAAHGTVTLYPNGSFSYQPDLNYYGYDSFTYKASDGLLDSSVATVYLTVVPVNDPPVAANDSFTVIEDGLLTPQGSLLDNDGDVDNVALGAELVSNVSHGNLSLNSDGTFSYAPTQDYTGTDSFTYRAYDGAAYSAPATVTITVTAVNDPPVFTLSGNVIEDEDFTGTRTVTVTPGAVPADESGQTVSYSLTPSSVAFATVSINAGTGAITIAALADKYGAQTFTVTANDQQSVNHIAIQQFTLTINPVNDAPVAVSDSLPAITEDDFIEVSGAGVLANDTDTEGSVLTAQLVSTTSHGALSFNSDGTFIYTPAQNFNGSDSFTYKVSDGELESATATVSLTVSAVNDPPVFTISTNVVSLVEDFDGTSNIVVTAGMVPSDEQSQTVTYSLSPASVVFANVTINPVSGSISIQAVADGFGTNVFTVIANDGQSANNLWSVAFLLEVAGTSDAPVVANDSFELEEDGGLTVGAAGVLWNDQDPDGDALTVILVAGPDHGTLTLNADGTFDYDSEPNFNGMDTFIYKVRDTSMLESSPATVTLMVAAVNDPPVFTLSTTNVVLQEDFTGGTTIMVTPGPVPSDESTQEVVYSLIPATSSLANVVVDPDTGEVTITALPDANGSETFYVVADDQQAEYNLAYISFVLTINPVNDSPVALTDPFAVNEDTTLVVSGNGVLANDTDPDGDGLLALLVAGTTHGNLTFNTNGTFTYAPNAEYFGTDTFTYRATDGILTSDVATVTITINSVNDAPLAQNDSYVTLPESGANTLLVLTNDTDVEQDTLLITTVIQGTNGVVSIAGDSLSVSYTPNPWFAGNDLFSYVISDGNGGSSTGLVAVLVWRTNNTLPSPQNDWLTVDQSSTNNVLHILVNDTDPDSDILRVASIVSSTNATVTLNFISGTSIATNVLYTPNTNFFGVDTFTYTVTDGTGGYVSNVLVTVFVRDTNSIPPSAIIDFLQVQQDSGTNLVYSLDNDFDIDGDPVRIYAAEAAANGLVLIATDDSLLGYAPDNGFFGIDPFNYTITDDRGGMDTNRVHIFVNNATNTPPWVYADNAIIQQDSGQITINVLTNDVDDDSDTVQLYYVFPPSGGSFTTNAGAILYTPDAGFYGVDAFYYAAHDGQGGLAFGQVNVFVNRTNNTPPVATSDTFTVTKNSLFNILQVRANDTDAENNLPLLVYDASPATDAYLHVALDGTYIALTPVTGFTGTNTFTYLLADTNGGASYGTVTVEVIQGNTPPTAQPDTYYLTQGGPVTNLFVLGNDSDADNHPLTIMSLSTNVASHAIITNDNGTNYIVYAPPANMYGVESFRYTVGDGNGGTNSALVTVYLSQISNSPPVAVADTFTVAQNSVAVPLLVLTNDYDAENQPLSIVGFETTANGSVQITGNGTGLTYTPALNFHGVDTFTYYIADSFWAVTNATVTVTVLQDTSTPPVAVIANMTNNIHIREGLFELRGEAYDPDQGDAVGYQILLYKHNKMFDPDGLAANLTPFPRNAEGYHANSVNPTNVLGTLDFTMVRNGAYDLVLLVKGGNKVAYADVRILLNSGLKIGQFTFSQQDMIIPVNGLPLTVVRTYDSLNPDSGDFGHAWTWALNEAQVDLDEFREPTVDFASPTDETFLMRAGGGRNVTLTLPDGRRTTFEFYFKQSASAEQPWMRARFRSPVGVYGTLAVMGDDRLVTIPTFPPYWYDGDPRLPHEHFDFRGFYYTNRDGTIYVYERKDLGVHDVLSPDFTYFGVQSWGQPELTEIWQRGGDRIVLDRENDRIQHYNPSGALTRQIVFQRDPQGRIIGVTDPKNQDANGLPTGPPAYAYTYDAAGNLSQVFKLESFQAGQSGFTNYLTTTYVYGNTNFPHYITEIIDPRGKTPLKTFYDEQGRLSYTVDANNKTNSFSHDIANRTETITDRLGNQSLHRYDTRGNVTESINALGEHTTRAYDDKDNLIAQTNDLGQATLYAYDANGNRTAVTNALGHVVRISYDAKGQVTSVTDAKGNTTANAYDGQGNLLTTADAQGHVSQFFYDGENRLSGSVDPLGNSTTNTYDNAGNLTAMASYNAQGALLNSAGFSYDLNGRQTGSTRTRTLPGGGTENITSGTVYDAAGQVTHSYGPDNLPVQTIYNEIGKPETTIDKAGRQTHFVYDDRGHTVRTTYPDLTAEGSFYDDEGRRTFHTNRQGKVTQYLYDALGRLTNSFFLASTGAVYQGTTVYDRAGRVNHTVSQRGTVSAFGYDDAGRRTSVTNAWGTAQQTVSQFLHDANGNQVVFLDALGRGTTNVYDSLNRRTHVLFHDGTSTETLYDQGGRRVWERDQGGVWTGFGYDGSGRLMSVTNAWNTPVQMVTRYEYDEAGNQTAQIDAKGNITRYEYDSLGRRTKRTLPGNQVETYAYDVLGSLTNRVDFNGKATAFLYDAMNRLVEKRPHASFNAASITFAYDALGMRTNMVDASGVTSWAYDERQRLVSKTVQWYGQPAVTLSYAHDEAGLLTGVQSSTAGGASTAYAYDDLGRLSQVGDVHNGTTTYSYNAVGSLQGFTYGNGVWHGYQYDALNRLTNLVAGKALNTLSLHAYTLGAAGNRLSVTELSGRVVNYAYDQLYRLVQETVSSDPENVNGQVNYGFDAVGNRTTRSSTLPGIINQNFAYNANDWLNAGVDHGYDSNGNTLAGVDGARRAVVSEYDFENRLIYQSTGTNTVFVTYDGDGNRVRKVVIDASSTNSTYYLVDTKNLTGYAQVLEEHVSENFGPLTLMRVYGYGHGLISQRRWDGQQWCLSYYAYDGHGSVRFLTDTLGNVTDTYEYDAFGNLIAQGAVAAPTPNHYRYTGEQWDSDLGFYYLRARYSNPDSGRFWTMDSYEGGSSDPLTLHKYLYCHANPVNGIDPSGHITLKQSLVAIGLIGVIGAVTIQSVGYIYSGYTVNATDLSKANYKTWITDAANAEGIEPRFLAAILATEIYDRDNYDNYTDILGSLVRDQSVGLGQVKPSTAAGILHQNQLRAAFALWNKKKNIEVSAKYIKLLIEAAKEQHESNPSFQFTHFETVNGALYTMNLAQYQQPMSGWDEQHKKLLAQQYTQLPWRFDKSASGRFRAHLAPRATAYADSFWENYTNAEFQAAFP